MQSSDLKIEITVALWGATSRTTDVPPERFTSIEAALAYVDGLYKGKGYDVGKYLTFESEGRVLVYCDQELIATIRASIEPVIPYEPK